MSDDPSDPNYISPLFGKKIVPSYYDKQRAKANCNLSLLESGDSDNSDTDTDLDSDLDSDTEPLSVPNSSALSPEDEDLISKQSEQSKLRFLSNPVPGAPPALRSGPLTYEEARDVFLARIAGKEGKPSKLTPERLEIITENIRRGTPRVVACGLAGIADVTLVGWIRRGEEDISNGIDSEFSRVVYEILIAQNDLESRLANKWIKIVTEPTTKRKTVYREKVIEKEDGSVEVVRYAESDTIEEQGDGNWQGIAEYMSRRMGDRWKKTERVEQTGPDGGPIQVQQATIDVGKLSAEERKVLFGIVKREVEEERIEAEKRIGGGEGIERAEEKVADVSRGTLETGEE